ncbi:uncharacterized protein LOC117787705 [Drosophila innubila]|uniref:uncharacterized protein LOC117787705 n=1 Tax=Drosophila innubila TaxID=198719 RepID=UPI00148DC617|nr:uncharacterized protein LOC117787705 [Drosophila innubila]
MLKIVLVLCAVYATLSQARPHASYLPSYETIEYAPTVLGYESLALPAAVSHQSSTVVHEKRPYWRPIVEHSHHTPLLKSYSPTSYAYASEPLAPLAPLAPLSYGSEWYEPGWNGAVSYPSIYLK